MASARVGTPILLAGRRHASRMGPEMRRGLADLERRGRNSSGGIVVVRYGADTLLSVIRDVKAKLAEVKAWVA